MHSSSDRAAATAANRPLPLLYKLAPAVAAAVLAADIWDTAGQERFNSMHASYYYRAHVSCLLGTVTVGKQQACHMDVALLSQPEQHIQQHQHTFEAQRKRSSCTFC
jgi:GTPase SAR1 family protein